MVIKSISYDQEEIIENILKLHVPSGKIDCDPTYSKGNFYKGTISKPKLIFDINPLVEGVEKSCATCLPLEDSSIGCLIFDPPFLAATGKSLTSDTGNITAKRFGIFDNEILLHCFYKQSIVEFHRILQDNGILIFKCQDKVSSGKNYFTHNIIMMQAVSAGFYPKDLFVLLAKNRVISGKHKNQKHCRKFHSYFWVFEKRNSKIDYNSFL